MKFEKDPNTGIETNFARDLKRMNESQRKAWNDSYNPRNEEFIRSEPTGKELAKWKFHRYLRDYLKCIKSVDDAVGEVLSYLEKKGLEKNTVLIYTSDQGF